MTSHTDKIVTYERKKQELRDLENEIALEEKEAKVKRMSPISDEAFVKEMRDFATKTISAYFQPWEFQDDYLYHIREVAIRAGLRPNNPLGVEDGNPSLDPMKHYEDVEEMIENADLAREEE